MLRRFWAITAPVLVLFGGSLATATADDDVQTWTMPELKGGTLQNAADAVWELTDNPELVIHTANTRGWTQEQRVWEMWTVCWQYPEPGDTFDEDEWIGFGVARSSSAC